MTFPNLIFAVLCKNIFQLVHCLLHMMGRKVGYCIYLCDTCTFCVSSTHPRHVPLFSPTCLLPLPYHLPPFAPFFYYCFYACMPFYLVCCYLYGIFTLVGCVGCCGGFLLPNFWFGKTFTITPQSLVYLIHYSVSLLGPLLRFHRRTTYHNQTL